MEPSTDGAALPTVRLSRSGGDIPRRSRVVGGKGAGSPRRTHCRQGRLCSVCSETDPALWFRGESRGNLGALEAHQIDSYAEPVAFFRARTK